jgi:TonB family protein
MHGAYGETKMLAVGRFVATGFFTGDRFTGVLIPLNDSATTAFRGPRMLSGLLSGDATLTLSANADVPPDSPSAEGWVLTEQTVSAFAARVDRPHRGNSRTNGLPQPDARLPLYGEYVFVEQLPEALTRVPPQDPDDAREAGVQGTVMVQVLVTTNGTVADTRIAKSIPPLDEAAKSAVMQWVFRPAMANGQPVAVWLGVPVKFSLH